MDDVDIIDKIYALKSITNEYISSNAEKIVNTVNLNYWESPEAIISFKPKKNEDVLGCLRRREEALLDACVNDDALLLLLNDVDSYEELSIKKGTYSLQMFIP